MLKKITTTIIGNPKVLARKVIVLTGVTLGIGIGILLNKSENDPDVVVIEEFVDEDNDQDYRPVDEMTEDEVKDMDANTSS